MLWSVSLGSLSGVSRHLSVLPKGSVTHHRSSRTEPKASCVKGQVPDTPRHPAGSPSPFFPHASHFPASSVPGDRQALLPQGFPTGCFLCLEYPPHILHTNQASAEEASFTRLSLWLPARHELSLLAFLPHGPCASLPYGVTTSLFLCWLCCPLDQEFPEDRKYVFVE